TRVFFVQRYCDHRDLHSFPTRRSSDLIIRSIKQLLLSAFQKKNNKDIRRSMLQEFITSALVIDDDFEEVKDLISYLEDEKDIWARYFSPSDIESKTTSFNNRKIIFLDLYLDDSRSSTDNIAVIRKYFKSIIGENFGT